MSEYIEYFEVGFDQHHPKLPSRLERHNLMLNVLSTCGSVGVVMTHQGAALDTDGPYSFRVRTKEDAESLKAELDAIRQPYMIIRRFREAT